MLMLTRQNSECAAEFFMDAVLMFTSQKNLQTKKDEKWRQQQIRSFLVLPQKRDFSCHFLPTTKMSKNVPFSDPQIIKKKKSDV